MGGNLSASPQGKAPALVIRALRDPDGANLDRIQAVKGWLDGAGELHEQVYDVVVSDGCEIDREGRCRTHVGDTADVTTATFTNSIGEALLMGYWKVPHCDAVQRAFYYVRVLEVPTPRWSTYNTVFFAIDLPEGMPPCQQERGYASPVSPALSATSSMHC